MGRLRLSHGSKRIKKGRYTVLTIAICLSAVAFFLGSSSPYAGSVAAKTSMDTDGDLLSDLFETMYGTNIYDADSDDDGFIDGLEFTLRSDPNDLLDIPSLAPGMRVAAYEEGKILRMNLILFPGDISLIQSFVFYLAFSQNGNFVPNGHISGIDLTGIIPYSISDASFVIWNKITISSYTIDLPAAVIRDCAPVSIGVGAKLVGEALVDILDFDVIDNVLVKRVPIDSGPNPPTYDGYYSAVTGDPPQTWNDDEVCKTSMEVVGTEDGITTFEITEAECNEVMKQVCSPSDCAGTVGSQVISIDPGFITEKL